MERSLLFGWSLYCFIPDCCSLTTVQDKATIIVTHICKAIGSRQDRRSKPVILNFLSHCGGHLIYDRNLLNNFCDGERGWAVEISNYPFNSTKNKNKKSCPGHTHKSMEGMQPFTYWEISLLCYYACKYRQYFFFFFVVKWIKDLTNYSCQRWTVPVPCDNTILMINEHEFNAGAHCLLIHCTLSNLHPHFLSNHFCYY